MTDIDIAQYPETVEAFEGNAQRATVFLDRYALKGEDGKPVETTPEQMWSRVSRSIGGSSLDLATIPTEQGRRFYDLLADFKFVPGGRILAGAGTGTDVTFYNCYVIPVETKARRLLREFDAAVTKGDIDASVPPVKDKGNDSREAIIDTIGVMVDIMSRGGGVGINWSVLRPAGAHLKRINATSSGPIDWMHFASTAVGTVEQGGSRRGAAMFMLDDWHPNVLDFIDAKRDLSRITNANVSVAVSDQFMEQVRTDGEWPLVFPDTSHPAYDSEWDGDIQAWTEKYPKAFQTYAVIKARDLWRKLAEAAWDNGEPGVVFLDRYNKQSTAQGIERLISVNPCGEQGLGAYSVCNLGSMNLAAYVTTHQPPGPRHVSMPVFDWDAFGRDVETAVQFMDRVIDENHYFIPENEAAQKDLRRIGLGAMGLADALVRLGLRYGSPEAVRFTEQVFREMKQYAVSMSASLAERDGPAPAWRPEMLDRPYLQDLDDDVRRAVRQSGLRNMFLLTQAPTGTTSILAGVNSGIEPFFALGYWREDRTGRHYVEPKAVASHTWPDGVKPGHIVTANEVTVEEHIAMQAAVQKHVDSSVSKTINAPNSHTIDDVERAYTLAYESGLKGLAYFRDGCGRAQVLSTEKPAEDGRDYAAELMQENIDLRARLGELRDELLMERGREFTRPDSLTGRTHKVRAGQQTSYVTVNRMVQKGEDKPVEVFVNAGKAGTDLMAMGEAVGRLASIALQRGATLDDLIDQLEGVGNDGMLMRSLPSAIAVALKADKAEEARAALKFGEFARSVATFVAEDASGRYEGKVTDLTFMPTEEDEQFAASVLLGETQMPRAAIGDVCPECGGMSLIREEGCQKCHACGYAAC